MDDLKTIFGRLMKIAKRNENVIYLKDRYESSQSLQRRKNPVQSKSKVRAGAKGHKIHKTGRLLAFR